MVYGVAEKKGIRVQLTGIAVPDQYEQLWQLEGRNPWAASNQTSNQPEKLLEESQQVSNYSGSDGGSSKSQKFRAPWDSAGENHRRRRHIVAWIKLYRCLGI